ncbi:hypothetical protein ABBQ32_005655 [Trebouxia sp. C0010 RCD-2024]
MGRKGKVAYLYDGEVGGAYYGIKHPMKPHRMRMTNELIIEYGLADHLDVYKPNRATAAQLKEFHTGDYIQFLERAKPETVTEQEVEHYNVIEDSPIFDGVFQFCQIYAGASIHGAQKLIQGDYDIAINWSGGLHHAKKSQAEGFCYVNDLVLAILELLKYHARVLYLDLDVHHGDGVEEAFITSDRVMTVSFHRYGQLFFPGTGSIDEIGFGAGKHYTLNIPFESGLTDSQFWSVFQPVMQKVMDVYQPGAVVLQCGADSLGGDKLGDFNLSIRQHAEAVDFMKKFGLPMLVTGGGGYKKRNVARCWTYETAVLVGKTDLITDQLPNNKYLDNFRNEKEDITRVPTASADKMNVDRRGSRGDSLNKPAQLERIKLKALQYMSKLEAAPGHGFYERQPDAMLPEWRNVSACDEDAAMHDYAVKHLLLKDIPDVKLFEEDVSWNHG